MSREKDLILCEGINVWMWGMREYEFGGFWGIWEFGSWGCFGVFCVVFLVCLIGCSADSNQKHSISQHGFYLKTVVI